MSMSSIKSLILLAALLCSSPAWAASSLTPAAGPVPSSSSLYDYRTTYELQEEFAAGNCTAGSVGTHGWLVLASCTQLAPEAGEPGAVRIDTTATPSTTRALYLYGSVRQFLGSENYSWLWRVRLNNNDANTTVQVGLLVSVAITPARGVYLQKLDADTNWHCVTRDASTSVPVDSGVATSTDWVKLEARKTAAGVQFSIDGVDVCGLQTANVTADSLLPVAIIVNSESASKTFDAGYYEQRITGLNR